MASKCIDKTQKGNVFWIKIALASILIAAVGGLYWMQNSRLVSVPKGKIATNVQVPPSFTYQGEEGKTALAILENKYEVKTKQYSFGKMVVSINQTPSNKNRFWAFYVNGKMSSVGASKYVTQNKDVIKWKLEEVK